MWTREQLKNWAKDALNKNYWKAVLASLILAIAVGGSSGGNAGSSVSNSIPDGTNGYYTEMDSFSQEMREITDYLVRNWQAILMIGIVIFFFIIIAMIAGTALKAFAFNPFEIGAKKYLTGSLTDTNTSLGTLVSGFNNNYMNGVKTMFLRDLFIWLWSLLLVVPGIIKGYEYRMIPYLLGEHPEMDYKTAFALSRQMMDGEKWNAFVLDLSFLGWNILSIFTCGILSLFYVAPYENYTDAALYKVLSTKIRA